MGGFFDRRFRQTDQDRLGHRGWRNIDFDVNRHGFDTEQRECFKTCEHADYLIRIAGLGQKVPSKVKVAGVWQPTNRDGAPKLPQLGMRHSLAGPAVQNGI